MTASPDDIHRQWKQNERAFQERKYDRTPEAAVLQPTSIARFTKEHLTPCEDGGNKRGRLMALAIERLTERDVKGKSVLDYCCGRGDLGVFLAMMGADVCGFDFSARAIEIARRRAEVNGVRAQFDVMDAESLAYPDGCFDCVIGFEALHHVIIYPKMPAELRRILRPVGVVVFGENWGGDNLLLQLWRSWTTLRRNRSAERGEVILSRSLLTRRLEPHFGTVEVTPMSLIYMVKRHVRSPGLLRACRAADRAMLRAVPALEEHCGESVIVLRR